MYVVQSSIMIVQVYRETSQPMRPKLRVMHVLAGEPSDTPKDKIKETIHKARKYVSKYGPKAVAFQFAQVGNDQLAQQFLAELDNDPKVSGLC